MTIIAFGSLHDCNFIIADRENYNPISEDKMEIGERSDKIYSLLNNKGFASCTGDKFIFDFFKSFEGAHIIPSFEDEEFHLEFVQELNIERRNNDVPALAGRDTGIFICTEQSVSVWRIAFNRELNTYQTDQFWVLEEGRESYISYFGRLHAMYDSEVITRDKVLQHYTRRIKNMLSDPQHKVTDHNLEVTNFILDEVNYGIITKPEGTLKGGLYKLQNHYS